MGSHPTTAQNSIYVADTWPPLHPVQVEQVCQATGKRKVSYAMCTALNTSPARNRVCRGCACIWRVCIACNLQHATASDMRDIDPKTGLCPFHTAHGVAAVRPPKEELASLPSRDSIAVSAHQRPLIAEDASEDASEENEQENSKATYLPPQKISVVHNSQYRTDFSPEVLCQYAKDARARFISRRIRVMRYLAADLEADDIALLLESTTGSIKAGILLMGNVLSIPYPENGILKSEFARAFLGDLYRYLFDNKLVSHVDGPQ